MAKIEELAANQLLKRALSLELLEKLPEPKAVWKYFLYLTEYPRKSHNLGVISKALLDLAPKLGVQADVDEAGNIRFRKEATKGKENAPGICIQAHIDMVTSANADVKIDFDVDPITPFIDGDWLKATGTTLGADNGLGVAGALAILEDVGLEHGPLEALFTVDEETTMGGGEFLAPSPFLQSQILLNVDSEEEDGICIGCAGGLEATLRIPISREVKIGEGEGEGERVNISYFLSGLLGGHSGIDIHQGRANANKLITQIIHKAMMTTPSAVLVSLSGGNQPNVITREASVIIQLNNNEIASFQSCVNDEFKRYQAAYLSVEHVIIEAERKSNLLLSSSSSSSADYPPMTRSSSLTVLDAVAAFPHGVIRMSYDVAGLVESSNNLSKITTCNDYVDIHTFARSSIDSALTYDFMEHLRSLGRLVGGEVIGPINAFPGWDPDVNALALKVMKECFLQVRGKEGNVYAVHAGLECGFVKSKYPSISCVSVGPEIHGAHSPDEAALIPSVTRYYSIISQFVRSVAQY